MVNGAASGGMRRRDRTAAGREPVPWCLAAWWSRRCRGPSGSGSPSAASVPGGTACALTLQRIASQMGRSVHITLLEGKQFANDRHYNQCAGVLAPPLAELLEEQLGVPFPDHLSRGRIPGYVLHAGGDSTIAVIIDLMERTGGAPAWKALRVRLEHGDGLAPDLLARARARRVLPGRQLRPPRGPAGRRAALAGAHDRPGDGRRPHRGLPRDGAEDRMRVLLFQPQQQSHGPEVRPNIKKILGRDLASHDAVAEVESSSR